MEDWAYVVIVLVPVFVGGLVGVRWFNSRNLDPVTVRKTLALKDKYITELERDNRDLDKEVRHWQGKFGKAMQLDKVEVDAIPNSPEGIEAFVDSHLPEIASQMPKEIKGWLLKNKPLVVEYCKNHPEIIKQYVTTGKIDMKGMNQQQDPNSLEARLANQRV
jgi:hypothetical protein